MVDTPGCYSHSLRGGAVSQRPLREEMMRLRLPSLNTYDKDVFIIFCRACYLRRLTHRLLLLTEVQNTKMQLHTIFAERCGVQIPAYPSTNNEQLSFYLHVTHLV